MKSESRNGSRGTWLLIGPTFVYMGSKSVGKFMYTVKLERIHGFQGNIYYVDIPKQVTIPIEAIWSYGTGFVTRTSCHN